MALEVLFLDCTRHGSYFYVPQLVPQHIQAKKFLVKISPKTNCYTLGFLSQFSPKLFLLLYERGPSRDTINRWHLVGKGEIRATEPFVVEEVLGWFWTKNLPTSNGPGGTNFGLHQSWIIECVWPNWNAFRSFLAVAPPQVGIFSNLMACWKGLTKLFQIRHQTALSLFWGGHGKLSKLKRCPVSVALCSVTKPKQVCNAARKKCFPKNPNQLHFQAVTTGHYAGSKNWSDWTSESVFNRWPNLFQFWSYQNTFFDKKCKKCVFWAEISKWKEKSSNFYWWYLQTLKATLL